MTNPEKVTDATARERVNKLMEQEDLNFMLMYSIPSEDDPDDAAKRQWIYLTSGVRISEVPICFELLGTYLQRCLVDMADFHAGLIEQIGEAAEQAKALEEKVQELQHESGDKDGA